MRLIIPVHESTNKNSEMLSCDRIASPYILFFARRHAFGYFAFLFVETELESPKNIAEHDLQGSTAEMGPWCPEGVGLSIRAPKLPPERKLESGSPSRRVIHIQAL